MASTSGRLSLTMDQINNLNFLKASQLIDQLGIQVDGKELDLNQARLILLDFISKGQKSPVTPKAVDPDTTFAAMKADLAQRTRLRDMYIKAEKFFKQLPKPFQDDLGTVFPNYQNQLAAYRDDLQTSQCVLLFAGEMGSGKTTLINLLLGREILPTSDLRCTAAIVEISYGPKPLAVIHPKDDSAGRSAKPLKLQCDSDEKSEDFLHQLEKHIIKRDDETDESPYEKIELQWPFEMLKGGVVIVDSPGVGGSHTLPQQLVDYMERAFGFIYVIDITGGIHKHRLGQLLLKAVETNDGFEPGTTLFVCNRWDMVPSAESEKVKQSMADKLSYIIPGVSKNHLYPISAKQAKEQLNYNQVSSSHKALIEGIRTLLPQSMKGKLRFYYRYLSTLLKRSLYSLRVRQNMQRERVANMRKNYNNIETRLRRIQQNAQDRLKDMRKEMTKATMEAGFQAIQHLDSTKTRVKLMMWSERDCPPNKGSWQNIHKNANMAIAARVAEELNNWEKEANLVSNMQNEVIKLFQREFELLDNEIGRVEALLVEDVLPARDFAQSVRKNFDPKKQLKMHDMKNESSNFMSLGTAVSSKVCLNPKDPEVKALFKEYGSDPSNAMTKATELFLALLNETTVLPALTKYFDRFVKGIDRIGEFMPEMMKADQKLLKDLDKDLESGEQMMDAFPVLSKECGRLQGSLDMFYVQKLFITDFTNDQLQVVSHEGSGSFATVYKAKFKSHSGTVMEVAIKEPKEPLRVDDVTDTLLEESMLRDLSHDNFVKYFGVCRKGPDDNIKLLMVMEYCPYTLKKQRIDNGCNSPSKLSGNRKAQQESIEIITNYLVQICNGLKFLHSKAIVHRDLKPANVLLTRDSRVKIADLGLAKKVKDIATLGIGTPVYMSPEILLHFTKYDTKADIYSLAMIMWELWYGEDMAQYASDEIHDGLKNEIERGWRPTLSKREAPGPFWTSLITQCWSKDPADRPTADQVGLRLLKFYKEFRSKGLADSGSSGYASNASLTSSVASSTQSTAM